MIVHHLNCATMCPLASRLVNDAGSLVCHCLLVESDDHLTLIETGLAESRLTKPTGAPEACLGPTRRATSPTPQPHVALIVPIPASTAGGLDPSLGGCFSIGPEYDMLTPSTASVESSMIPLSVGAG